MFSTTKDDSIALHYQPLTECHGEVVGFEALMRWHHQGRGQISPEAFIPIFEKCGVIIPLSRWALTQACFDAASWTRPLGVAVNVSPMQFRLDDLPALVRTVLVSTGLDPTRLELEMTEEALVADPDNALNALIGLRDLGIGIALDDFGTRRSSPAHLKDYPFTKIKIDRSFVLNIETSVAARSVVSMVIDLGHSLTLLVAAEGVESAAQLAYLRERGCDLVQGYFTGRPAPIETFASLTGSIPTPNRVRHSLDNYVPNLAAAMDHASAALTD